MNRLTQLCLLCITLCLRVPAVHAAEQSQPPIGKILFLGNSITTHAPLAKVDWAGNWGMAASAEDKDYVHLVLRSIAPASGKMPEAMILNIAAFERDLAGYDLLEKNKAAFDFNPDVVVVAIGENVPTLKTSANKEQFKASVLKVLRALQARHKPAILVRSCFWADRGKDEVLKEACAEAGCIFVDISSLAKDESNYARSERTFRNGGVAKHPGDKGMQAIASALIVAMKANGLLAQTR